MSNKFQLVDDVTIQGIAYLHPGDKCIFYGELMAGQGYEAGPINNLIFNFKKSPTQKGLPGWQYKANAIITISDILNKSIPAAWIAQATWVPIPPSKAKSDPGYDDRIIQVLNLLRGHHPQMDIRELIAQTQSAPAAHTSTAIRSPSLLKANYAVDTSLIAPAPQKIVVFDDVLTSGSHFRAISDMLGPVFPGVPIVGLFIARAIR